MIFGFPFNFMPITTNECHIFIFIFHSFRTILIECVVHITRFCDDFPLRSLCFVVVVVATADANVAVTLFFLFWFGNDTRCCIWLQEPMLSVTKTFSMVFWVHRYYFGFFFFIYA